MKKSTYKKKKKHKRQGGAKSGGGPKLAAEIRRLAPFGMRYRQRQAAKAANG